MTKGNVNGKETEVTEVGTTVPPVNVISDLFLIESVAVPILNKLNRANRKIRVTEEEIKALFSIYDIINALDYDIKEVKAYKGALQKGIGKGKESNVYYSIDEYPIPEFLRTYLLPTAVTISGDESDPDCLIRKELKDEVILPFTPAEAESLAAELFNYLRVPYGAIGDRPRAIALSSILSLQKLAIGAKFSTREGDVTQITMQVSPKILSEDVMFARQWSEYLLEELEEVVLSKADEAIASRGGNTGGGRPNPPTPPIQETQPGNGEPIVKERN